MSDHGAYEDEMGRFFGSDDELDRLFDGTAADERFEDLAFLLADVKASATTSIPGAKAEDHIAALSAEAARLAPTRVRVSTDVAAEPPRWRVIVDKNVARMAKLAAGVMTASLSLMGLAHAGVDLPGEAAAQAFESVTGVELPNQEGEDNASPSEVALAVQAVIDSFGEERGCEFGQAVAAAASQGRSLEDPNSQNACAEEEVAEGETETEGEAQGSKATGEEASAEGRAKATEKSGGASDAGADNATTGTENAESGEATATEKSGGASDAGADNAGTGDETEVTEEEEEDGEAEGSRETGEEAASEGQGNSEEVPAP